MKAIQIKAIKFYCHLVIFRFLHICYLGQIGRFSNTINATEGDGVGFAPLLGIHCITQYVNPPARRQNLHQRLF